MSRVRWMMPGVSGAEVLDRRRCRGAAPVIDALLRFGRQCPQAAEDTPHQEKDANW
jgi:hypothetical protein